MASGALPADLAGSRARRARDFRHDGRSRRIGHVRRPHGVHQPDDGGGHLEPGDRRGARQDVGSPRRLTQDAADDYDPTLSEDGVMLVFRSRRAGRFDVSLKNLTTNAETVLTQTAADDYPAISRDGQRVAYSSRQHGKLPVFVVAARGGAPEQVCDDCGEVEAWMPDGRGILYVTGDNPAGVGLLSLGSSPNRAWLRHPGYGIFNPRVSNDGQWVSFNARANRLAPARVLVAPVDESGVANEKDWIVVAEEGEAPAWSPQADLLYFWSERDGSPCLWAQRLDQRRNDRLADRSPFSTSTAGDSRGGISTSARRTSRSPATRSS